MKNIDYRISKFLLKILFRVFYINFKICGLKNVPDKGSLLIISNHISNLDPPIILHALNRPVGFMAKSELFKIPVLSWIMNRLNCFPVKRGVGDRASLTLASEKLVVDKTAVCLFPEGTRSVNGMLKPFKKGFAYVWAEANYPPILPIVIKGSENILKKGAYVPTVADVEVKIGNIINLDSVVWNEQDRKESASIVCNMVEEKMQKLFKNEEEKIEK